MNYLIKENVFLYYEFLLLVVQVYHESSYFKHLIKSRIRSKLFYTLYRNL